jgi:hypothetical protein
VMGMGGYLIYFVAVKSFQYGLPVYIPLMGSAAFLLDALRNKPVFQNQLARRFITGAVYLVFLTQCILNIQAILAIVKI